MIIAMLKAQPGSSFAAIVGNQSTSPETPIIPTPQNTAQ